MKNTHPLPRVCSPAVALAIMLAAFATGCTTVVRENIISNINTGVGLSLTENPQTQLYEIRAGYIRSQFYSIPTSKKVEDSDGRGASISHAAHRTPEVVAGIRMKSGIEHLLLGMDIAENFAVGPIAVNSPAATAMYISQAADAARAGAASRAASAVAARKSLADFGSRAEQETAINAAFDQLNADQRKQLYQWADAEFPKESDGKLARENNGEVFKNGFLPLLESSAQRQKILDKITSLKP